MSKLLIGLTGGIGSGKSAVSGRFAALGVSIADADVASRAVVAIGTPALQAIVERFGASILKPDGTLDRAMLRQRVFSDPEERRWLEQLTHPLIGAWLAEQLQRGDAPYSILVNPLLIESGQARMCQRVLVVDATEAAQLQRTMLRDANSEAQVRAIMQAQAARSERLAAADDIIINDRDLAHLDAEVARLHAQYLELADERHH